MKIQTNTANNLADRDEMEAMVAGVVEKTLVRFSERITRVEVHLSDENSHKGGAADKRCMMEVRLEGRQPIAVTHQAESMIHAVEGAAKKAKASLESTLGRLSEHQGS